MPRSQSYFWWNRTGSEAVSTSEEIHLKKTIFYLYLCGHVPKKSPINSERLGSLNEELFWNGAKDWYLFIPKYLIMVLRLKCNFHILYDIYPSSFEANCLKWQCCKHYKACFHFSHCFPFMFLLKLQPMLIIQRFEENELFLDKNV